MCGPLLRHLLFLAFMQAAEARKRAGFDVKEKDAPAWMRKPASSVPARPPQSRSGRILAPIIQMPLSAFLSLDPLILPN